MAAITGTYDRDGDTYTGEEVNVRLEHDEVFEDVTIEADSVRVHGPADATIRNVDVRHVEPADLPVLTAGTIENSTITMSSNDDTETNTLRIETDNIDEIRYKDGVVEIDTQ